MFAMFAMLPAPMACGASAAPRCCMSGRSAAKLLLLQARNLFVAGVRTDGAALPMSRDTRTGDTDFGVEAFRRGLPLGFSLKGPLSGDPISSALKLLQFAGLDHLREKPPDVAFL